ncbi:MAG: hypothetical protein LUE17_02820 [Planctomycetaceae bacterium]|nr:hypothetical protein [Planctomycetaceae bacterium]
MLVLVLESSTSAAKALLYDADAGVVATASENYGPDIDAGGLHDADAVFRLTARLGRKVADGREVAAVAVCGVWHSLVACDDAMRPVTPTYLWNFTGTDHICRDIRSDSPRARAIYTNTGCMPNITYQPYAVLHMRRNGLAPEGKRFASQAGYNFFHLTGERLETRSIVSGMGFLNTHTREYDEEILALCGLAAEQLGMLTDYRGVCPLSPAGAELLGIPPGIPVVPPHSDGALNQVGNGASTTGSMTFSVGTSAAIRLSTDRPILSDPPATWCYVGVEGWMSGAATNGACNCINWFKETVLKNAWSFDELGRDLLDRSRTPTFLPFLFGERCPGWDDTRRGGFCDLNGDDGAPALFRAVSEGILYNVYQCYRILTDLSGQPERIILSGGILNSPGWVQMAADIFCRELLVSDNPHASLLGGAALALHAAGRLPDLATFGETALDSVTPRADATDGYRAKFDRYLHFYTNGISS